MLFKFASYLLGSNNDTEQTNTEQQQLNIESNENTQDTQPNLTENSSTLSVEVNENSLIDEKAKQEDLIEEDDYMYAEQLINCSKLKNSNLDSCDSSKDDHLCDQLEDEDCDDDHWIYITPIKRKNEEDKDISEEEFASEHEDETNCGLADDDKETSKENVPTQPDDEEEENGQKEKFNFYDYFNNKSASTSLDDSPVKSSKTSSSKKLMNLKLQQLNRMEQSWVIHPPACFQFENTFTIEEHPLENLYIENPALSVMASCKFIDKENTSSTSSSTNSSSLHKTTGTANRVLVNLNNQTKEKASVASRKSMRKRANSTRKTGKKQNANSKKSKKQSSLLSQPIVEQSVPVEQQTKEDDKQKQLVLREKQILAHYLTLNPSQLNTTPTASNTIATPSSSGSIHQSTNHSHNHTHHHYISSNCVATLNASTNASVDHKKGSRSLKRNNKVALKRENLSNKPFTLHRKLC